MQVNECLPLQGNPNPEGHRQYRVCVNVLVFIRTELQKPNDSWLDFYDLSFFLFTFRVGNEAGDRNGRAATELVQGEQRPAQQSRNRAGASWEHLPSLLSSPSVLH